MVLETREVLDRAYVRQNTAMLTHLCSVNDDGIAISVHCDRVRIDSIADRYSGVDLQGEPTCISCRRSWRVYQKERPDMFVPLGERKTTEPTKDEE